MRPSATRRRSETDALRVPSVWTGFPFLAAGLGTALLLAACTGDQGDRVPLDRSGSERSLQAEALPPEIQSRLDSGNAAYRARDYEGALAHFTEVSRLAPDLAAGWYGIGMTWSALGNQAAADSAMMRAHRLAPDVPLQHPTGEAPPNPHPVRPPPTGNEGDDEPGS